MLVSIKIASLQIFMHDNFNIEENRENNFKWKLTFVFFIISPEARQYSH